MRVSSHLPADSADPEMFSPCLLSSHAGKGFPECENEHSNFRQVGRVQLQKLDPDC